MMIQRRTFLKGSLHSTAITLAVSCGLLSPVQVLASTASWSWNREAFAARNLQTSIKSALGSDLTEASNQITIQAPEIAENGAVVPVTVSSTLKNVSRITLLAEKNTTPLAAVFDLDSSTEAFISTRLKMGQSSNVIAIVTAGDKNFSARKDIKVTIGGCGG